MDQHVDVPESLLAEVSRLRQQNAELQAALTTKLGLVWERDALAAEKDLRKAFIADLVVEEDGAPVSMLEDNPGNIIVEGNNIGALKVLRATHAAAFDCIFIDPPYGTGNTTWLYNDDFVNPKHRFKESGWLSWMEPRLEIARDMLSPTGCILVCIDDSKRAVLDLLMEQLMPGKRIGSLVWRTRQGANDRGIKNLSVDHEHLLVYGNPGFEFGGRTKTFALYKHFDPGSTDPYRISDLTVNVAWDDKRAGFLYYPLHDPESDVWYPCNPNAVWRFGSEKFLKPGKKNRKDTMEELVRKKRIIFPKARRVAVWNTRGELDAAIAAGDVPKNGKGVPLLRADLPGLDFFVGKRVGWGIPQLKRYKSELTQDRQPLSSWIRSTLDKETASAEGRTVATSGSNREGSSHLSALLGGKVFNYPKPLSLIKEVLRQATSPDSLVLDFFAGSGTTGEAVLELNLEDEGTRRFVLVSNTEATPKDPKKNLCRDVCARRIRAAIAVSGSEKAKTTEAVRSGFSYLRLAEYDMTRRHEEFSPERIWTLALLRHGLPIRPWQPLDGIDVSHLDDGQAVAFMPQPTMAAVERLKSADSGAGMLLYTSYPSRVRPLVSGRNIEVIDASALEPVEAAS
jgi:adenine-specific DNA-methyltransferase